MPARAVSAAATMARQPPSTTAGGRLDCFENLKRNSSRTSPDTAWHQGMEAFISCFGHQTS